jgi:hypothetical protein
MEAVWKRESGLDGLDEVLYYYSSQFPPDAIRVYFTSNHDENSHSGSEYERMGQAARAFAVICATLYGMPMIYSGQELPNQKRLLFFEKDCIPWTGRYELHGFYKALLECRTRNPALRGGDPAAATRRIVTGDKRRCFGFVRSLSPNEVVVLTNISGEPLTVPAADVQVAGFFRDIFTGAEFRGEGVIEIEPWGYKVLERQ